MGVGGYAEDLARLRSLRRGWLGDGAGAPISGEALAAAERLCTILEVLYVRRADLLPTEVGGCRLEWAVGRGEVSIEIGPDGRLSVEALAILIPVC